MPRSLPKNLLCELISKRQLALCLDYDGTIAPITSSPEEAVPPPEIRDVMIALTEHPDRLLLVVASGRRLEEVQLLLAIERPVAIIGTHGLELMDWNGRRRLTAPVAHCLDALDKARVWLNATLNLRRGFFIEDKRLVLALHYRGADRADAAAVVARLKRLVNQEMSELQVVDGDRVSEFVPRVAPDKGFALLSLLERNGSPRWLPAYFSNDVSDEGAFYKLRPHGVTALVGPERRSCTEYRLESRADLTELLARLADTLHDSSF